MQHYSNRLATDNGDHDGKNSLKKYHELIIFFHARLYHLSGLQWEQWPSSLTMCTLMACFSIIPFHQTQVDNKASSLSVEKGAHCCQGDYI